MGWLQSLLGPLKKLWVRFHSAHRKRRGIYILYEDVKSCQYEDVHVLWSILVESHPPALPSHRRPTANGDEGKGIFSPSMALT